MTAAALVLATPLVARFEGLVLHPYRCPAGVWTIGYGNTFYENGTPVQGADPAITKERATALLASTLSKFAERVDELLPATQTVSIRAALYSFAYNLGVGALAGSTLLKKLRRGDVLGAASEFPRWNMAAGLPLAGLTHRRQIEAAMFLRDSYPDASAAILKAIGDTL